MKKEYEAGAFPGLEIMMGQILADNIQTMLRAPFKGFISITGKIKRNMHGLGENFCSYLIAGTAYDLEYQHEKAWEESDLKAGPRKDPAFK
jgi:hypothetical protein